MADITPITSQTSTTSGSDALQGIKDAVTNLNDDKLEKSLYDANSILYATTDNTPVALTVGASTIVGRKSTGNIVALTATETRTILNVADGATANSKATGAEVDTGTDDTKFVTVKAINDSHNVPMVAPGTIGNVMISNGTDWVSSAVSGDPFFFGDGSDGSVTFDGSSSVLGISPSGSAYTLTRDIYTIDCTINNGVTINTNGWRIFSRGTFTLNATSVVQNNGGTGGNGGNASANTAGTAGTAGTAPAANSVLSGQAGTAGNIGGVINAVGLNGVSGTNITNSAGTLGGLGGSGGTSTGFGTVLGGTGGAVGTVTAGVCTFRDVYTMMGLRNITGLLTMSTSGTGGGGGSACNSSGGNNAGGGGGGGGGTGGMVFVAAWVLAGSGTLKAIGGNGGNGGNAFAGTGNSGSGGGGTGGGGAGGIILLVSSTATNPYTCTVTGGTGGSTVGTGATSGTGFTGANGSTGASGASGKVFFVKN